jgi:hypothetical protein
MIGESDYSVRPSPGAREVTGMLPVSPEKDEVNERRSYRGRKRRRRQQDPPLRQNPAAPAPENRPPAPDDSPEDEHSVDYLA